MSTKGLLHCEMGAFRRAAEDALDQGKLWQAEKYFRFVEQVLPVANPDVENALEVSFLEDLALGECTPARRKAVKERMPWSLRKKVDRRELELAMISRFPFCDLLSAMERNWP